MKRMVLGASALLILFAGMSYGSITADLTASDFGYWILGGTAPTNGKPIAVASVAPDEDYIVAGYASAFYWETIDGFDDEGKVSFWIYDSAIRLDETITSGNGPYWGLRSTDLGQVAVIGVIRRSYVGGDIGYKQWSSVSPFSVFFFRDGVRGSNNQSFSAGWYRWTFDGTFDNMSATLHNVLAYPCDGPACNVNPPEVMDVTEVHDANVFGGSWAGVFGFGWSGIAFKGESGADPENFYLQITGGDGVFSDVAGGTGVSIAPTATSSWGAIKKLY